MASRPSSDPQAPSSWTVRLGFPLGLGVLGLTLAVYPSTLNPGLPILLGGGLAVLVAVWRLARGCGPYYHVGLDVGALLLGWMALCSWSGMDAYLSQRSLATFVGAVAFLWLPGLLIRHSSDWRLAAHLLVAFTSLASLQAWPDAVNVAMESGSLPPLRGTFVNPDTFSVLPLIGLTLAIGLFDHVSLRTATLLALQMGLLFLTLAATGCRASLLGFGVGTAAFLGLMLSQRGARHLRKAQALLGLPLALALLAIPLSNFGFSVFGKYATTLQDEAFARETTRVEVATLAGRAALARPLLGSGPGCFGLSFQTARQEGHDRLYINIAHNDPLEVVVELGFPGLALWLALLGCCLSKAYRLLKTSRRPVRAAGLIAGLSALTTYSLFNFILAERPVLWAQMLLFGLALSLPSSRLRSTERLPWRLASSLGLLGLACWASFFGARALRADAHRTESQLWQQQLQIEQAMSSLDAAIALQPNRATLRLERAALEDLWAAYQPDYDGLPRRLQHLQAAYQASPADLGVLTALAQAYQDAGQVESAQNILQEAQTVAPFHQEIRQRRAALAIRLERWAEALDLLLQDPPSKARDSRLIALLLTMEQRQPESGVLALRPHLQNPQRSQDVLSVLDQAITACETRRLWDVGLRLANLQTAQQRDDLCAAQRRAALLGHLQGEQAEWSALDQALTPAIPSREPCYGRLIGRWSALGHQLGQTAAVAKRLTQDLESDPRMSLVRLAQSELWRQQGERAEAIALVRQGLDFEPRSLPLLGQLAALYEENGSRDLALNYYSEAARIEPTNPQWKAKIAQLQKKK